MQVGLARGRARSVVGGTRCSWSRSAGPSLLGRYPGASEWTAEQVAEHWGCISDSRCRHGGHCRGCSILRAFVAGRISGKAPPWSPRESKKAILKMPLTRATSGASITQEVGFHAARTTGRRSLALGRTPPPCLSGGRGCFHDSANLNLAKRRLCVALGISLGSSEHCCAISVARVRAALTASIPRSNRPLARRTNFGAAKSCSLVIIFMIRPPTAQSGDSNNAHRSRPYHGSRNSGDSERPMGAFNSGLGCPRSSRQSQTRLNTSAGSSP